MTDDILSQVKQAEQKADDLLDLAKEEAHKLVEEAKIRADNSYKEEVSRAKTEANNILDEAKAKALEESKPVIEKAKNKSEEIKNQELAGLDKTVDLLIERIINNGNS